MELVLPDTVLITGSAIIAVVITLTSVIGVYYRLSNQVEALSVHIASVEKKMDTMTIRNTAADAETEKLKVEHADQKTAVAVIGERLSGQIALLNNMNANLNKLVDQLLINKGQGK